MPPPSDVPPPAWTRERVESRLIAAFRLMPGLPVYGRGRRMVVVEGGGEALSDVLAWSRLLDDDEDGRLFLWAWARCRATRASFGALCDGSGWKRTTAEVGRRRAARAIATQLSSPLAVKLS